MFETLTSGEGEDELSKRTAANREFRRRLRGTAEKRQEENRELKMLLSERRILVQEVRKVELERRGK